MEFLRSVVQQDVALTASSQTDLIDLPVNPISHILLTIRGRNDTGTLSNYRLLQQFMDWVTNVEVLFKGQAIMAGSLQDLAMLNAVVTGFVPGFNQAQNTDNDFRACTFMLSFSRVPYWKEEAFPASSRGELQLRITTGAAPTGMDAAFMQVEVVELLNVNPERFLKYTAYTGTASATGEADRDLPRGNPLVGTLLFGTTVQQVTGSANTIEQVKLLVDNREMYYSLCNWETLHGELLRRIPPKIGWQGHFHNVGASATFLTVPADTDQAEFTEEGIERYAYLDFDPIRNNDFLLMTEGRGRVALRITYGVTDAMRFIPIELVPVAGTPPAVQ